MDVDYTLLFSPFIPHIQRRSIWLSRSTCRPRSCVSFSFSCATSQPAGGTRIFALSSNIYTASKPQSPAFKNNVPNRDGGDCANNKPIIGP